MRRAEQEHRFLINIHHDHRASEAPRGREECGGRDRRTREARRESVVPCQSWGLRGILEMHSLGEAGYRPYQEPKFTGRPRDQGRQEPSEGRGDARHQRWKSQGLPRPGNRRPNQTSVCNRP